MTLLDKGSREAASSSAPLSDRGEGPPVHHFPSVRPSRPACSITSLHEASHATVGRALGLPIASDSHARELARRKKWADISVRGAAFENSQRQLDTNGDGQEI